MVNGARLYLTYCLVYINLVPTYRDKLVCDLRDVECNLLNQYVDKWRVDINNMPKLRTYVLFKHVYITESYISKHISRRRRSLMAQFRTGVLPLAIEKGRFTPIYDKVIKKNIRRRPDQRLCILCNNSSIEDEFHFLCICPIYVNIRDKLY